MHIKFKFLLIFCIILLFSSCSNDKLINKIKVHYLNLVYDPESLIDKAKQYETEKEYAKAEFLHARALKMREHKFGKNHPYVANSLDDLANCFSKQQKYEDAVSAYQKSLDIHEKIFGKNNLFVAKSLNILANCFWEQKKYEDAASAYQQSLNIHEKVLAKNHRDLHNQMLLLAVLYVLQNKYTKAEPLLKNYLIISDKGYNAAQRPPEQLYYLAEKYYRQKKYLEAEQLYNRYITLLKSYIIYQVNDLLKATSELSKIYKFQKKFTAANELFKQILYKDCIKIRETISVTDKMRVQYLKKFDKSKQYKPEQNCSNANFLYTRELKIKEHQFGNNHLYVANSLNDSANCFCKQQKYEDATFAYDRALDIYERILGKNHIYVANSLNDFANCFYKQQKYEDAASAFQRSLDIHEKVLGKDHRDLQNQILLIALCYVAQKKYDKAEHLRKRYLKIANENCFHSQPPYALAKEYYRQGKFVESEQLYKSYMTKVHYRITFFSTDLLKILNEFAEMYKDQKKFSEAEQLYKQCIKMTGSDFHIEILADFYLSQRKFSKAKLLYKKILMIYEKRKTKYSSYSSKITDILNKIKFINDSIKE